MILSEVNSVVVSVIFGGNGNVLIELVIFKQLSDASEVLGVDYLCED